MTCYKLKYIMNFLNKIRTFLKKHWFLLIMLGMLSLIVMLFKVLSIDEMISHLLF